MNSMSFTPKDVEKGELRKFLDTLLSMDLDERYNEIHIWSDSFCTIVDWECVPWDHSYGGTFEYVDEDHEVISYSDK